MFVLIFGLFVELLDWHQGWVSKHFQHLDVPDTLLIYSSLEPFITAHKSQFSFSFEVKLKFLIVWYADIKVVFKVLYSSWQVEDKSINDLKEKEGFGWGPEGPGGLPIRGLAGLDSG
jgi:hypothetical protein